MTRCIVPGMLLGVVVALGCSSEGDPRPTNANEEAAVAMPEPTSGQVHALARPEAPREVRPEARRDASPETSPEASAETRPEAQPQAQPSTLPSVQAAAQPAAAPEPGPEPGPEADPPAIGRPAVLDRVVAVGASVTAGFGTRVFVRTGQGTRTVPVGLGEAIGAAMPGAGRVRTAGDLMFFSAPSQVGRRTLAEAAEDDATLVVALDWLFWFAYGNTAHEVGTERDAEARMRRVEAALQTLDAVQVPIVVGDVPDMSAAAGGMLRRSQVCPEPVRLAINRRIAAWAAERPDTIFVGLGSLAAGLQRGDRLGAPEGATLLKRDRLHTTVDGLVVLARAVAEAIDTAREDVGPSHRIDDHSAVVDRLVSLAGG